MTAVSNSFNVFSAFLSFPLSSVILLFYILLFGRYIFVGIILWWFGIFQLQDLTNLFNHLQFMYVHILLLHNAKYTVTVIVREMRLYKHVYSKMKSKMTTYLKKWFVKSNWNSYFILYSILNDLMQYDFFNIQFEMNYFVQAIMFQIRLTINLLNFLFGILPLSYIIYNVRIKRNTKQNEIK